MSINATLAAKPFLTGVQAVKRTVGGPARIGTVPANRRVTRVVPRAQAQDDANANGLANAARTAAKNGVSALAAASLALSPVAHAAMDMTMGMDMDMSGGMSMEMSMPGEPAGEHTSKEWQIWAYSTAAPKFLGERATVVGADGSVLREGKNGWTCVAGNPRPYPAGGWSSPHEAMPVCGDAEGMKWIQAFVAGETPKLERDTIMYMLHGDMGEDNSSPMVLSQKDAKKGQWIESGRHLMVMPKDPASLAKYPTDFNTGMPYQMFAGTEYVHLMVPAGSDYFAYQPQKK